MSGITLLVYNYNMCSSNYEKFSPVTNTNIDCVKNKKRSNKSIEIIQHRPRQTLRRNSKSLSATSSYLFLYSAIVKNLTFYFTILLFNCSIYSYSFSTPFQTRYQSTYFLHQISNQDIQQLHVGNMVHPLLLKCRYCRQFNIIKPFNNVYKIRYYSTLASSSSLSLQGTINTSSSTSTNTIAPLPVTTTTATTFNTSTYTSINPHTLKSSYFDTLFTIDLPEGTCVGLRLSSRSHYPNNATSLHPSSILSDQSHWIRKLLHPQEVDFGVSLPSEPARLSFFIGRLAVRTALNIIKSNNISATTSSQTLHSVNRDFGSTTVPSSLHHHNTFEHHQHSHSDSHNIFSQTLQSQIPQDCLQLPIVSHLDPSILKDQYGRPRIPHGYIGSISHKKTTGVALVNCHLPTSPYHHSIEQQQHNNNNKNNNGNDSDTISNPPPKMSIGVDIEQTFTRRKNIAKKVLTTNELQKLGNLKGITRDEEVLLRFSLKESVYKAMHPLICQFVGFQEAEIEPHDDGTASVYLNLKSGAHERFQEVKAHWRRIDDEFFLTSSSIVLKDDDDEMES